MDYTVSHLTCMSMESYSRVEFYLIYIYLHSKASFVHNSNVLVVRVNVRVSLYLYYRSKYYT